MDRGSKEALQTIVNKFIRANGKQLITGDITNSVITDTIDTLFAFIKVLIAWQDALIAERGTKGFSQEDFTTVLRSKLVGLNEHYRGTFVSLSQLQAIIPNGNAGDHAIIVHVGENPEIAVWDTINVGWQITEATPITVDQEITEGSINPVAGGAVFNLQEETIVNPVGFTKNLLNKNITTLQQLADAVDQLELGSQVPDNITADNNSITADNNTIRTDNN